MKRYVGKHITWKDFPKFAGKDLWILVYDYDNSAYYYIKILSETNLGDIRYNRILARVVQESIYESNYDWYLDSMYAIYCSKPELFTVIRPLEILSTEEVLEALYTDMIPD